VRLAHDDILRNAPDGDVTLRHPYPGGFSGDGGPATKAGLSVPGGVALNGTGGLVIADTGNQRIRVVSG